MSGGELEGRVARVLTAATYLGVALIGAGTLLMALGGVSPLAPAPALSVAAILDAVTAGRPEGLLWVGIVVLVAGPILRVVSSGLGFVAAGERRMVAISLAILIVIAASVLLGLVAAAAAAPGA